MPRYIYDCAACKGQFEVNHGMFYEQRECILCNRIETLTKVPSFVIKKEHQLPDTKRTGAVVDQFIEDAKKELKDQKKDLKKDNANK